jgi:hypothetical protein
MILIKSNDSQELINELYQCVYAIIGSVPRDINKFSDILFETIHEVLFSQPLHVLSLINLLNASCNELLTTDMFLLLPKVLTLIEQRR